MSNNKKEAYKSRVPPAINIHIGNSSPSQKIADQGEKKPYLACAEKVEKRTLATTEQSIYLNNHIKGQLPSLKQHVPISSFFISKQLKNRRLHGRYGKSNEM